MQRKARHTCTCREGRQADHHLQINDEAHQSPIYKFHRNLACNRTVSYSTIPLTTLVGQRYSELASANGHQAGLGGRRPDPARRGSHRRAFRQATQGAGAQAPRQAQAKEGQVPRPQALPLLFRQADGVPRRVSPVMLRRLQLLQARLR